MKAKKILTYWMGTMLALGTSQMALLKSDLFHLIAFCVLTVCTVVLMTVLYVKRDRPEHE